MYYNTRISKELERRFSERTTKKNDVYHIVLIISRNDLNFT